MILSHALITYIAASNTAIDDVTNLVTHRILNILCLSAYTCRTTRGQSSRGLDNSRTGQLTDNEFLKIMELLYFICTLNLTLTITVTLSNIDSG